MNGKTIAITRSKEDAAEFIQLASDANATPVLLPTIELVSRGDSIVDEFLEELHRYDPDYSIFMSSKAVSLLFDTSRKLSKFDQLQLAIANTTVIAVGPKTRLALEHEGIKVNHMPSERFSSVGVGEVLTKLNAVGKKAIIPRSGASTPFLKELLNKIGIGASEVYLYDICASNDAEPWNQFQSMFFESKIDGIVFTSASSVRAFFEIMGKNSEASVLDGLDKIHIVAIGPFTSDELKKFGIGSIIAQVHTVSGAFDAIKDALSA